MRKVVLIRGVTGGIGKATALIFKKTAWHVIRVDRKLVKLKNIKFY